MNIIKALIFFLSLISSSYTSAYTIRGQVKEMGTRKELSGVKIFFLPLKTIVQTDINGKFKIELSDQQKWKLIINLSGYKKYEKLITSRNEKLDIYLEKIEYNLFETTIIAKIDKRDPAKKSLTYAEFQTAPGAGGDPIKAVANLPGINRSARGANIIIQGGEPEDTQYSVNQQYIPIVFHFGGLTSVIMPEAIESIDYLSAGFGPEYGRALGGVINLNTRSPRTDRYYGIGYLDILNGGLLIEGPINKKSSFLISSRKSWVGEVLEQVAKKEDSFDFTVAPSYTDFTLIYEYRPSKNKKYSITGLYSIDELEFVLDKPISNDPTTRGDFKTETSFNRLIGRLDHNLGDDKKYFSSLATGKNKLYFKINDQYLDINSTSFNFRFEYQIKLSNWYNYFGVDTTFDDYTVGVNLPSFDEDNGGVSNPFSVGGSNEGEISGTTHNLGLYSRHTFQVDKQSPWIFSPGIRLDYYSDIQKDLSTFKKLSWQPRVSLKYMLNEFKFFKFSSGVYTQLPEERQSNSLTGNPYLKPLRAEHLSFGYENDFRKGSSTGFKLYSGIFYKKLDDLVNTSSDLISRDGSLTIEQFENETSGEVYGGELYLQYRNEAWSVNTSYTIAKSEKVDQYDDRQLSEFDQTHNLNIVTSYKYKRWLFSTRARFVTGSPLTPVVGAVYDSDNDVYIPIRGDYFSERNKDFIQFDFRVDYKWIYQSWILSAYLDIQNVTNRENSEGINYNYDYSEQEVTSGAPILPTFGLKGEF